MVNVQCRQGSWRFACNDGKECGGHTMVDKECVQTAGLVAVGGKACGGEKHECVCITMC